MSVITISRELGSLGDEIAREAAEKLNYEFLDKEKIEPALSRYGILAPEWEKFDEKKPSFWDSFLLQRKRFLHSLEAVIYDFARKGNAVVVGRGGQVLLKDLPGVLHVRILAPFEVRLKRILAAEGGDEKKAARALHRSDRDSAGFLRSFFEVDWADQTLYDLVINTEKVSAETAVRMITAAATSAEIREGARESEARLADLALTQKAEAALLEILGTGFENVSVLVKGGVVTLSGQVGSEKQKTELLEKIGQVEGVKAVSAHLYVYARHFGP
jgi:cytidylate kinase